MPSYLFGSHSRRDFADLKVFGQGMQRTNYCFQYKPPPTHTCSVLLAAKQAIYQARDELYPDDDNEWFQLDAPAAPERLQLLCGVRLDHMRLSEEPISIFGAAPPVTVPGGERW